MILGILTFTELSSLLSDEKLRFVLAPGDTPASRGDFQICKQFYDKIFLLKNIFMFTIYLKSQFSSKNFYSGLMPLFEEKDLEGKRRIEISPAVLYNSQKLCQRILEQGGSSLIIDYGHEGTKEDTFRAFKNHELIE